MITAHCFISIKKIRTLIFSLLKEEKYHSKKHLENVSSIHLERMQFLNRATPTNVFILLYNATICLQDNC